MRQKLRYPRIIQELELMMKEVSSQDSSSKDERVKEHALDFDILLHQFALDAGCSNEELLKQGFRRAYRQLVEGV